MTKPNVIVANESQSFEDAVARLGRYFLSTLQKYDAPGPGIQGELTEAEVIRTRVVRSRISNQQVEWFVRRGGEAQRAGLWIDDDAANLLDAAEGSALFEQMTALFSFFYENRPRQVRIGKIAKVLHIKYPALYPIVDDRVRKTYRGAGRERMEVTDQVLPETRGIWRAIRNDLMVNAQENVFQQLREEVGGDRFRDAYTAERSSALLGLSDLRMLDILTWRR
jgi:hypothetical protein